MKKRIPLIILILLIVIQFFRPARNNSAGGDTDGVATRYTTPDQVQAILKHSCYDCHSNHTVYPWYANVQPVGWWIQHDINDAKRHLNFSEFASYPVEKAKDKFGDIEDAATNGWMPLDSYLWLHGDTRLTPEESKQLASWAAALK